MTAKMYIVSFIKMHLEICEVYGLNLNLQFPR